MIYIENVQEGRYRVLKMWVAKSKYNVTWSSLGAEVDRSCPLKFARRVMLLHLVAHPTLAVFLPELAGSLSSFPQNFISIEYASIVFLYFPVIVADCKW